ncbi:MAG: CrcB family protein [Actinomycetia bacterium]|nr:CrcB family protein [Actinomycetes bacterium]
MSHPPDAATRRVDPAFWQVLGLVALGGAAGASVRYGSNVALPHDPGQFPFADLAANLVGCLLMGLFLGVVTTLPRTPPRLTPLLATGFLGGLTTFSSYAADAAVLADAGATAKLFVYVLGTLLFGWLLLRAGWTFGRRGERPDEGRPEFGPAEMGD